MRINRVIILIGVIISCGAVALAAHYLGGRKEEGMKLPDAFDEMKKVAGQMGYTDSVISIGGNIRITDSEDANRVKEESTFLFEKNGASFYSQLASQVTISDGKTFIQLDTAAKYLVIAPADADVMKEFKNIVPAMDSVFNDTNVVKASVSGNNTRRQVTFTNALTPNVKSTRMSYDAATYQLQYAEIDWWKHPDMISSSQGVWTAHITYRPVLRTTGDISKKMKEVIQYKDNKLVVADKYKSYVIKSSI